MRYPTRSPRQQEYENPRRARRYQHESNGENSEIASIAACPPTADHHPCQSPSGRPGFSGTPQTTPGPQPPPVARSRPLPRFGSAPVAKAKTARRIARFAVPGRDVAGSQHTNTPESRGAPTPVRTVLDQAFTDGAGANSQEPHWISITLERFQSMRSVRIVRL